MNKRNQMRLLRQCAVLFAKMKVCNEGSPIEWMRIVFAAHKLGYLYCGFDQNGNIDLACIAYRVENADIADRGDLPLEESGETLFVTAVASIAQDRMKLYRLMKWYLNNNLEINQVAYDYRNSDRLHKVKIRRGHGGIKQTKFSKPA